MCLRISLIYMFWEQTSFYISPKRWEIKSSMDIINHVIYWSLHWNLLANKTEELFVHIAITLLKQTLSSGLFSPLHWGSGYSLLVVIGFQDNVPASCGQNFTCSQRFQLYWEAKHSQHLPCVMFKWVWHNQESRLIITYLSLQIYTVHINSL